MKDNNDYCDHCHNQDDQIYKNEQYDLNYSTKSNNDPNKLLEKYDSLEHQINRINCFLLDLSKEIDNMRIINNIYNGELKLAINGLCTNNRFDGNYLIINNKLDIWSEENKKIVINNSSGKICMNKFTKNIKKISGIIKIYNNDNNQLYNGIITNDGREKSGKINIVYKLSNRPLIPLGIRFNGVIMIKMTAILKQN